MHPTLVCTYIKGQLDGHTFPEIYRRYMYTHAHMCMHKMMMSYLLACILQATEGVIEHLKQAYRECDEKMCYFHKPLYTPSSQLCVHAYL